MIILFKIALFTTFRTIKVVLRGILNKQQGDYFYEETKLWANELLQSTKTKIIIKGIDNLNFNETYIYIANHTNLLDIPILIKALANDKINFIYRESLQKVPVLGFALKHSPFIPIVRENIKITNMEQANNILQNSGSVIIFPEGTRSKTGNIAKFKRGAFMLAMMSNKKIVPIAISGVEKITTPDKAFTINQGKVIVEICPPIDKLPTDRSKLLNVIENIQNMITNIKIQNNNMI
jgi:1-acyl-sn-glycerol-3-phosphate acyltransferase